VGKNKWPKLCVLAVEKSLNRLTVTTTRLVSVKIIRALMEAQITLSAAERIYLRYTFGMEKEKYSYVVLENMKFESLYLEDHYP